MSDESSRRRPNRYAQIIESVFLSHYVDGATEVRFSRDEFEQVAAHLGIPRPKNLGDLVYNFRYRNQLPQAIRDRAPAGQSWIIQSAGRSEYAFVARTNPTITPNPLVGETKIPNATPGVIAMYALSDEQALLARLRYNRLIDIFTGLTCYSLQNHLRTTVPNMGQVETDEVYIGIDKRGVHYVIPVQAKGGSDQLNVVQIEQDIAMSAAKFPHLVCRPVAAQFLSDDLIALFSFELIKGEVKLQTEKHYRLTAPDSVTADDLRLYLDRG